MSRERDLLQTALGILEDYEWGYGGDHHKSPEASILNDIRKLLAQPEQDSFDKLMQNCNARKEAIAELILCMRFSNKHDLAQAVLDYIQGLSPANREKRNEK